MARLPFLACAALALAACSDPERALVREAQRANLTRLRHDAAVLYKDAFGNSTQQFALVPPGAWPSSFRIFHPTRISVYRDGVAVAVSPGTDTEHGLYLVPESFTHQPVSGGRARFRPLREGLYLYDFGTVRE